MEIEVDPIARLSSIRGNGLGRIRIKVSLNHKPKLLRSWDFMQSSEDTFLKIFFSQSKLQVGVLIQMNKTSIVTVLAPFSQQLVLSKAWSYDKFCGTPDLGAIFIFGIPSHTFEKLRVAPLANFESEIYGSWSIQRWIWLAWNSAL